MKNLGFSEDVRFLPIIHLGRSGSTHLERSLSTAFGALSLSEIFNRDVSMPFLPPEHDWQHFFGDDLGAFLSFCVLRGMEGRHWLLKKKNQSSTLPKLVLFEYKPTLVAHAFHPIHSMFLLRLQELGMNRIVLLERRSVVRRLISSHSARKTGIYHSDQVDPSVKMEPERTHFDVSKVFDDGINPGHAVPLRNAQDVNDVYFAKLRLELRAARFDTLNLEYEKDICGPMDDVVAAVSRFTGVAATTAPQSGLVKYLSNDLAKVLTNHQEVTEYCATHDLRL